MNMSVQKMRSSRVMPPFFAIILFWGLLMTGCAKHTGTDAASKGGGFFSWFRSGGSEGEQDEVLLSSKAMANFERGRYLLAEEQFQKVRDRYPFSPYAVLAQLRLADCKFYDGLYEEAIPLYQEFEKTHPTNEAIPYVIFQQAMSYYLLMDSPDRDQTATRKVIEISERLLRQYPDSPYTFQARRMIREARERLAESEIVVATWYIRTGQYLQAANRLETVLDLYPETKAAMNARSLLQGIEKGTYAAEVNAGEEQPSFWRRAVPFL